MFLLQVTQAFLVDDNIGDSSLLVRHSLEPQQAMYATIALFFQKELKLLNDPLTDSIKDHTEISSSMTKQREKYYGNLIQKAYKHYKKNKIHLPPLNVQTNNGK